MSKQWLGPGLCTLALGAFTFAPLTQTKADDEDHHDEDGKASIEGTVKSVSGSCPNLRIVIAETRIETQEATRFEDGSCNAVKKGDRLEVKGRLSKDGTLTAWKVDFE